MRIALLINGVTQHTENLDFVFTSMIKEQKLLRNVIERLKIKYHEQMSKADFWEIFIYHKSKL